MKEFCCAKKLTSKVLKRVHRRRGRKFNTYANQPLHHVKFSNVDDEAISNMVANTKVRRYLTFEWEHRWDSIGLEFFPTVRAVLFEALVFEMSLQMNVLLELAPHCLLENENNSTQDNSVVQIYQSNQSNELLNLHITTYTVYLIH